MPLLRQTTLFAGRHLALRARGRWEFADRVQGSGVVVIAAVTENDEIVLTEQFRPPVNMRVVDLAAGLSGDIAEQADESLQKAAERELLEETGYVSDDWTYVFTGPSSAGMSTEMLTFFVARNCRKQMAGGGDESEEIQVHVVPRKKLLAWLKRKSTKKRCIDPKVYAAVGLLALDEAETP